MNYTAIIPIPVPMPTDTGGDLSTGETILLAALLIPFSIALAILATTDLKRPKKKPSKETQP